MPLYVQQRGMKIEYDHQSLWLSRLSSFPQEPEVHQWAIGSLAIFTISCRFLLILLAGDSFYKNS